MFNLIDLHIHSTNSDGQFSPIEIVEMAKKNNVGLISIADHDSIKSSIDIKNSKGLDIQFVNGIELSTMTSIDSKEFRIHMLGYGYDENNKDLITKLSKLKQMRETVNSEYLEKMCKDNTFLDKQLLHDIDKSKYINLIKYIVSYMNEKKYSKENIDNIINYMRNNKVKYIGYDVQDEEAISLLLGADAIPVLAHPYQYRLTEKEEISLIHKLKSMGLKGIEIRHSGDTPEGMKLQEKIANEENLLCSIGSDFHTDYNDDGNQIGLGKNNNLLVEDCSLKKELKRLNKIYRR